MLLSKLLTDRVYAPPQYAASLIDGLDLRRPDVFPNKTFRRGAEIRSLVIVRWDLANAPEPLAIEIDFEFNFTQFRFYGGPLTRQFLQLTLRTAGANGGPLDFDAVCRCRPI